MRTKVCSRCKQELPTTDFPLTRNGMYSQCRACKRKSQQESKDRYPHFKEIQRQEKHSTYYDPVRYSANVCGHVADYVNRAMARFEKHTGMEAPPHMTALVQVAQSFVAEHPPRVMAPRVAACVDCGTTFTRNRRKITCDECGKERKRSRERQSNVRKKERAVA